MTPQALSPATPLRGNQPLCAPLPALRWEVLMKACPGRRRASSQPHYGAGVVGTARHPLGHCATYG